MTATDLLLKLKNEISDNDWRMLEDADSPLIISQWNRATLLRMRNFPPPAHSVSEDEVESLQASLGDYLNRYMADQPEGHRWIILSCLFLAFIARGPLHPAEIVHHRLISRDGSSIYCCPAREESTDSLCRFCVCKPIYAPGKPATAPCFG